MRLKDLFSLLLDDLKMTVARPSRLRRLVESGGLGRIIRFRRAKLTSADEWMSDGDSGGMASRKIASYEAYLSLQASKLEYVDLASHESRFREILRHRLEDLTFVLPGNTVLCLAARLGAEVRAFRDLGCFAVGIDVNPGENNDAVLYGDFHNLSFPDKSVDIVFTNSVDHAFDIGRMFGEIERVLKNDGHVIIEADPGVCEDAMVPPDIWQTLTWNSVDDLIGSIQKAGFMLSSRAKFEYPRNGMQLVFSKQQKP